MRVDFVTETYPPEINGVARTVERMVHGLVRRGHRVRVIRPRQHAGDHAHDGIDTQLVAGLPLPGYRGLRLGLPAGRHITRLWQGERPDVLYVATEGPLGWSAIRAAARAGIPVVSGFHTNFHAYADHYGAPVLKQPLLRYLRRLHNRTRCTLVPTEELRNELGDTFQRTEVLGRGVDCSAFTPARRSEELRRSWGAGPADRVVLYVGRLAAEKNLPLALTAFRAMRRIDPRLSLVMVGGGPLYAALVRGGEPGASFTGALPRDQLIEHYASADIFLFPSESETFGNVTLEAMASGLAVVAFDYAAAHLLIRPGENGVLAPCGDHAAFTAAALSLAEPGLDLAPLRAAARQTALNHDWDTVLDRFEGIMCRCAATDAP